MFSNLENAIIFTAAVWGAVEVIKHFFPSYWGRIEAAKSTTVSDLEDRLDDLEAKLNGEVK
jgi:hypothetical protein